MNELAARCDALLHCAIEGVASVPPVNPVEGECWLVGSGAGDAWLSRTDAIAARIGGNWMFVAPRPGLRVYDRAARQERVFFSTWTAAAAPTLPSGGTVVDTQARTAIAQIYDILATVGSIPS